MLKNIFPLLLVLCSQLAVAQTDDTNAVPLGVVATESAFTTPVATTTTTQTQTDNAPTDINLCPLPSSYPLSPGYRLAGISPSCQAVQIRMSEQDNVIN